MNALAEVLSYFVHTCPNSDKNKTPVSITLDFRVSAARLHIICLGGLIIHHGARRSILSSDKRAVIEKIISDLSLNPGQNHPMVHKGIYNGRKGGEKEALTEFEPQLDGVMKVHDEVPMWKEPCR